MAFTTLTAAASFASSATRQTAIPDPSYTTPWTAPNWLIGLVASWFAFGSVLAVILLLAQFPRNLPRWTELAGQPAPAPRARGRTARAVEGRARATSSAVEGRGGFVGDTLGVGGGKEGDGFRMRKPRGLSVDTTAKKRAEASSGLGILMPAEDYDDKLEEGVMGVKKRVSFDNNTATVTRAKSSVNSSSSATAPLRQKKSFLHSPLARGADFSNDPDSDGNEEPELECPDVETGHPRLDTRDLQDRYAERRLSPYFANSNRNNNDWRVASTGHDDGSSKRSIWLDKMNEGAAKLVDRLAMAFYDRVEGAEEGLLLPVRGDEREGWMGRSVD